MGEAELPVGFRRNSWFLEEKTKMALRTMQGGAFRCWETDPAPSAFMCRFPSALPDAPTALFVSQTVERSARLIPTYVELLCEELAHTAEIANALSLRLEAVYIGGGTPTTLEPVQLAQVMDTIRRSFDPLPMPEYTVEAGRPDTITEGKPVPFYPRRGAGQHQPADDE